MFPGFSQILKNLATDYCLYIVINILIGGALKYARNDNERKKIWQYELGCLIILIASVYFYAHRLSFLLIVLAVCCNFVSRGMSVVEGVLQIALFSLGLIQAILAYFIFIWLTIWPLIQSWVVVLWEQLSVKFDKVSSVVIRENIKYILNLSCQPLILLAFFPLHALATSASTYWPRGLINQGNNLCFINTVFQCLNRIPNFTMELNRSLTNTDGALMAMTRPERPIAISVAKLLKELEVGDGMTMSQNNFRLAASRMNPGLVSPPIIGAKQTQQDVAEFTMWLLAVLHNAINIYQDNGGSFFSQHEVPPSMASLQSIFSSTERQKIDEIRQRYLSEIGRAESLDDEALFEPLKKMADLEWDIYGMTNKSIVDQMFTGQVAELHQCMACHRISVHIQVIEGIDKIIIQLTVSGSAYQVRDSKFCLIPLLLENEERKVFLQEKFSFLQLGIWAAKSNFTLLPVAVPVAGSYTSFSLEDCLRQFDSIEQLDGSNSLQCDCTTSVQSVQKPDSGINSTLSPDDKTSTSYSPQGGRYLHFARQPTMSPIPKENENYQASDWPEAKQRTSTPVSHPPTNFKEGCKRTMLCRLPQCLIVQLMRFRYDRVRKQGHKVHTAVVLNQNGLDLTSVALSARVKCDRLMTDNTLYRYQLNGFCLHEGGENTMYGHYVAYAPDKRGNWYKLEDENVQKVMLDKQLSSREVQQNVYLVFYYLKK